MRPTSRLAAALAAAVPLATPAANVDGTIDPAYGDTAGRSSLGYLESDRPALRALARSPFDANWAIGDDPVDVGAIYVARLETDGTPDLGFGDANGRRRVPVPAGLGPGQPAISVEGAFVQADGKPLLFGGLTAKGDAVGAFPALLCRIAAAGNFDASFGTDGCRTLRTALADDEVCRVTDAELAPDGTFLTVGNCAGPTLPTRPFVARVTAAGALDFEFGAGAGLITPLVPGVEPADQFFDALSVRPDGTFVVLAQVDVPHPVRGTQRDFAVMQFDGGGSPDGSFGGGDAATVIGIDAGATGDDRPIDLDLRPDGRLVVLAQAVGADPRRAVAALAQLTTDGTLDPAFDGDGIRLTDLDGDLGALSALRDVEIDTDGKVVVGGWIDRPGEEPPTAGTEFWIAAPGSVEPKYDGRVMISSEVRTSGVLEAPAIDLVLPFEVLPGRPTQLTLPKTLDLAEPGESFTKRGVRIRARDPITVHTENGRTFSLETALAQPTEMLGTTYRVLNWDHGLGQGSFFVIVGTEDGTAVTITPTVSINGRVAGVPYEIALDRGTTYRFVATAPEDPDTSGTVIQSTRPVVVYSGHTCAYVPLPQVDFCDMLLEQADPVERWGTDFLYAPYVGRTAGDIVRILAHQDDTVVSINGVPQFELDAGQFHEATFTQGRRISASKPILVHQYAVGCNVLGADESECPGDPNMQALVPTTRWQHRWIVPAPIALQFEPLHYVQVIAPTDAIGTVRIDGALVPETEWAPIANTGFSRAAVTVPSGRRLVTAAAPLVAYGHSVGDGESYAHPGASAPGGAGLDTDDLVFRLLPDGTRDPVFGVEGKATYDHAIGFETPLRSTDRFANLIVDRESITVGTAAINRASEQSLLVSYRILASELFRDSFE